MIAGQTSRSRAVAASAHLPHYLYRYYDAAGVLLYIGCTSDPKRRHTSHMASKSKAAQLLQKYQAKLEVDVTPYPGRERAQEAEALAILDEQPLFNTQGRCLAMWYVRLQIEDYEAGRPVRRPAETINPSPRQIAFRRNEQGRAS